jgi:hypothetical protein
MLARAWVAALPLPALVVAAGLTLGQEAPGAHRLPGPRFDGAAAWAILERMTALGPRHEEAPRRAALALVREDAARWGAARVREVPCRGGGAEGASLVAEFPGEGPRASERIVVLGHFDTVAGSPGALDDATGPALLAGLARALAGRPLERTVVLAAVDLEERGLVGARALAAEAALAGTLGEVRAAVSLEMLGWRGGVPVAHTFPTGFREKVEDRPPAGGLAPRWLAALTLAVGRDNERPLALGDRLVGPVYQLIFRHFVTPFDSDCGAYAERGVPALFLSDCSFTRFYPEYHRPSDTIAEVDRASLERAGAALEALVRALAARADLPRPASGPADSETDYLALGARVLPSWALRLALALAPLAPLLRAARRGARAALALGAALALATLAAAALAPVTASVVLLLAWLAAPALVSEGRLARALGALAALLPLLACGATVAAAMWTFGRSVPPSEGTAALALTAAVALLLPALALLAPGERRETL